MIAFGLRHEPGLHCSREFGFLVTLLINTKSIRDLHTMSNTDERSELDFWRILHSAYITIGSQAESEVYKGTTISISLMSICGFDLSKANHKKGSEELDMYEVL